jgi:adenine-specific DNA-methyltransferase
MTSPDLTASNVARIAELFPGVITETIDSEGNPVSAVDFDFLRQELSDHVVEGPQERYQLDWPGKRAAAFAANAPIAKTLRPVREQSVDFDTTKNLFIEGDNLDALKLLQESYLGKVDVIYIDPPYNTGSDSFVYPDKFAESNADYLRRSGQVDSSGARLVTNTDSNGRFHSDWLSMMFARLKLARNLLRDSGIIGISIGDDEVAQLRALCDEVFGEGNRIAQITVEMSTTQGMKVKAAQNGAIVKNSEFLLVYSRSAEHKCIAKTPLFDPVAGWPGNFGTWLHDDLSFEPLADYLNRIPELVGEARRFMDVDKVRLTDLGTLYLVSDVVRSFVHENLIHIAASDKGSWPSDRREPAWREGQAFEYTSESRSYVVMKSSKGTIRQFLRLSDNFRKADDYAATYGRTVIRGDLWKSFYSDMAHVSLEGATQFENGKKPMRLIENFVRWANNSGDALVMDFFAGSGTTAEAVMRMNMRDGGARKFLLVQMDEPLGTTAAARRNGFETVPDVLKDRLIRSGRVIRESAPMVDTGFRTFRLDTTNMSDVLRTPDETEQQELAGLSNSVKPGRTGEDLLFQVLLDWGLDVSVPIAVGQVEGREIFVVDEGALVACFDDEVTPELVRELAKREPLRVVFRDEGFASDDARINAEQIFRELSPATDVKAI